MYTLTSVPEDALDAVFGPALVLLQLLLLQLVLVLLLVALHPELSPHDATDRADCEIAAIKKILIGITTITK